MAFSEVLNKYKSNLNLTQSALAEICGTSPAVISRYLNGKRLPEKDSDIIKSIAKGIAEKSKDFPDLKLSYKDIEKELNDSLVSDDNETDFYTKLDSLLKDKDVSNTELSKVLPYDSSYISRVRNKKRIPKDQEEFLTLLENYLIENPKAGSKTEAKAEPKKESKPKTPKKGPAKKEGPTESPEPTMPKEPAKPTVPEEPVKSAAPKEPAKPTALVEIEPVEPKTPVEPMAAPTEPIESIEPSDTTATPKNPTRKPRQTRFEYFIEKVSSYIETIRNINFPL